MKNDPLHHLLKAAAPAPEGTPEPPPGLETRVLAHWREARRATETTDWMSAFRPAFLLASIVLLVSVGLNASTLLQLRERTQNRETAWSIADSAIRLAATP